MGIKELEKHLREVGDKRIAEIEKEKKAALKALEAEVAEASDKVARAILASGAKEAEAAKKRILARAKIRAKAMTEGEKIDAVDRVFEAAKKKVLNSPDAKKKAILKRLAEEASSDVRDPAIYVDKAYRSLLPSAEPRDIGDFGVVVESESTGVVIDNTLTSKLNRLMEDITPRVIEALFG